MRFLVTSRPYDDIEFEFQRLSGISSFIHFDGDDQSERISQEINLVIDDKVSEVAGNFSHDDRERISGRLKGMKNRTYLWLFLTIDIIKESRSIYSKASNINTLLSNLPSRVSDAYEKILAKSPEKSTAVSLLRLIVAATRPLSLIEANIALTLATSKKSYESQEELI